jgi:hypothetical protein
MGTSIETTLELWASSLRDVKAQMRQLDTSKNLCRHSASRRAP